MSESDLRRLYREQAPRPPEGRFSLEELLPGQGPLELDIGFGRGLSLFERAEAAPESRIVGIEVKTKLAYQADQRLRKHKVRNVSILCGDAREILRRAEPARSVSRASIHFPDPWWKKRHGKRRVIGEGPEQGGGIWVGPRKMGSIGIAVRRGISFQIFCNKVFIHRIGEMGNYNIFIFSLDTYSRRFFPWAQQFLR